MLHRLLLSLLLLSTTAATAQATAPASTPHPATSADRPIVIAHRGASGYRPEHTRAAYELAIEQGADYIEPDLVMTRDGVLIARHENEIGRSTDVASRPEFASRKTTKTIDTDTFTGWFAEDFTLEEIKQLRARERSPDIRPGSAAFDGRYPLMTLDDIIALAEEAGTARGRPVGLYIELKNPGYHASIGLPMEQTLVDTLEKAGLNHHDAPVYIQSFWPQSLMAMRALTPVRLTFLINSVAPPEELLRTYGIARWADVYSPQGLRNIKNFADVVGPEVQLLIPRDAQDHSLPATSLVEDAHAAGLEVHTWSVNAENPHLPVDLRLGKPEDPDYRSRLGNAAELARRLLQTGVDGVFSDHPDIIVRERDALLQASPPA